MGKKGSAGKTQSIRFPQRMADAYVFCLLKHQDKNTLDPLNLDQWEFYVLPTKELNSYMRSDSSITLHSLKILCEAIPYSQLREKILASGNL
jgi:hypothetical protein